MDLRIGLTLLVPAVAAQRVWELGKSARNEAQLRAAGGREHAPEQMPWMRAVHTLWLIGTIAEIWLAQREANPIVSVAAAVALVIGQTLRIVAIRTLGWRWTVKIMTLPEAPAVEGGIFRWIRHPNYLGVVLEIAALPLIGGAYVTAIAASIANALLLRARIRAEEQALRIDSDYDARLGGRPRWLPRMRGARAIG